MSVNQLMQLVGNKDLYALQKNDGSYFPKCRDECPHWDSPTYGDEHLYDPLTPAVLRQHLDGTLTVGTYVVRGDQAKVLAFDIDVTTHDQGLEEIIASEASAIHRALTELGVPRRSIGIEFSGRRGQHVWVLFGTMTEAKKLRRLGRAALAMAGVKCEVFPKQDQAPEIGSLIKLPLGLHKGSGKRSKWLTPPPQPLSVEVLNRILSELGPEPVMEVQGGSAIDCMEVIQQGVGEGCRNDAMFHLSAMYHRGGVAEDLVHPLMQIVNERNQPPLSDNELARTVESSANSGPLCGRLPDELRCQQCPVLRERGLILRNNQLRNAADGELVVVKVKDRHDRTLHVTHPDLEEGEHGAITFR